MRVKMFSAPTMAQAMEEVRHALGPDAIIISTHEAARGRGVEIRAAVERRAIPAHPHTTFETAEISPDTIKPAPADARVMPPQAYPTIDNNSQIMAEHAKLLRKALAQHGFSRRLGHAVLEACRAISEPDLKETLARVIDLRFSIEPIPHVPNRPIMLVGAPGVGKTATTAKLAARAVLKGLETHLITTDTLRTGAIDQLDALAQVMGRNVTAADTPGTLKNITQGLLTAPSPTASVFIDTPATNPYNPKEIDDLDAFARAANAEPVLVIAAGHEGAELIETMKAFAPLKVTRVIVTRLDAARRLGSIFSAIDACHLTLAHYCQSPYIGAGLECFTPQEIAQRILGRHPVQHQGEELPLSSPALPQSIPFEKRAAS